MSEELNEVVSLVEKAQAKGNFNLADFIKGRGYPEDSVEVYFDVASAYEISKLNDKLILIEDPEEAKPVEDAIRELEKKVLASRLKFNMRGIDQRQVESIEAKEKETSTDEGDDWYVGYLCALIAANIVSIENADGEVEQRVFTKEDVVELRGTLTGDSWEKIVSTMQKLTLASGYFKGLSDAGFLQKS
jgi:hypothetical protein